MNRDLATAALLATAVLAFAWGVAFSVNQRHDVPAAAPKTETLKCVRVKEVGADARITYKCEAPK